MRTKFRKTRIGICLYSNSVLSPFSRENIKIRFRLYYIFLFFFIAHLEQENNLLLRARIISCFSLLVNYREGGKKSEIKGVLFVYNIQKLQRKRKKKKPVAPQYSKEGGKKKNGKRIKTNLSSSQNNINQFENN